LLFETIPCPKKHTAGTAQWGHATGGVVNFDMFCCLGSRSSRVYTKDCSFRWEKAEIIELILYEKNFGWMDVWESNLEWWGLLWAKASATV
jgi:hypothetical protein